MQIKKLTTDWKNDLTRKRTESKPTPRIIIVINKIKVFIFPFLYAIFEINNWENIAPRSKNKSNIEIWYDEKWKEYVKTWSPREVNIAVARVEIE